MGPAVGVGADVDLTPESGNFSKPLVLGRIAAMSDAAGDAAAAPEEQVPAAAPLSPTLRNKRREDGGGELHAAKTHVPPRP